MLHIVHILEENRKIYSMSMISVLQHSVYWSWEDVKRKINHVLRLSSSIIKKGTVGNVKLDHNIVTIQQFKRQTFYTKYITFTYGLQVYICYVNKYL